MIFCGHLYTRTGILDKYASQEQSWYFYTIDFPRLVCPVFTEARPRDVHFFEMGLKLVLSFLLLKEENLRCRHTISHLTSSIASLILDSSAFCLLLQFWWFQHYICAIFSAFNIFRSNVKALHKFVLQLLSVCYYTLRWIREHPGCLWSPVLSEVELDAYSKELLTLFAKSLTCAVCSSDEAMTMFLYGWGVRSSKEIVLSQLLLIQALSVTGDRQVRASVRVQSAGISCDGDDLSWSLAEVVEISRATIFYIAHSFFLNTNKVFITHMHLLHILKMIYLPNP